VLSGCLVAIGGVYLSLGPEGNGTFIFNITSGKGFIALAAMIFGNWRPAGAFAAALLFGFSSALALKLQTYPSLSNDATLLKILPYVLVLVAVAGVIGRTEAPAADGKPYAKQ
jgi:simple sugar transport system permease protein